MRLLGVLALSLLVGGCATTRPLAGSDIEYRLPRTDGVATVTLTLKDCSSFSVDGTIAVAAQPGVSTRGFRIPGESLASARIKRSLKITKNSNDVLIGVNSTVADRTPQIVGNVIKTAATFVPLLAAGGPVATAPKCNKLTTALTARAQALSDQLATLQVPPAGGGGGGGGGGGPAGRTDDLDTISKQLAAVKTALTITFTVPLELPATSDAAANFASLVVKAPFTAWFDNPSDQQIGALFGMRWRLVADPTAYADVTAPTHPRHASRTCGFSLPVPYARRMTFEVEGTGEKVTSLKKSVPAFIGNWDQRSLCIDAGFGETRTNELAFDDFGHETSANWSSEARAETITGAIAGSANDVSTLITTIAPPTVKAQKAEIDELQTQQTLNKLRACEAVIRAGGTVCPSP